MVKESLEEGYLFLAAGAVCILAVVVRCLLGISYGYWARASNSMDRQNSKSLERLKKRFETMYQMNLGVKNVDMFVDKYLNTKKICGLYLSTWESISGQVRVLCGGIGIAAGIIGTYYDCGQAVMLSTISICAGGIAFTLLVDNFSGLSSKMFRLKTNISDYFENYLKVRLELYDDPTEYAAAFDKACDGFDDLGYGTYVNNKIEKAEKRFLEKKMKLERKEQIKKLKKEKKEVFKKVRKEKKDTLEQVRIQKEQEALAQMRKRREERQKERKERVLEEMRQELASGTEEAGETIIDEIKADKVEERKYPIEVENKIIEDVLKEFLV